MENEGRMKRRPSRALCVWPGLARLWLHGDYFGLLRAILFGGLLQSALVTFFVWPALVSFQVRWLIAGMTVTIWLGSFVHTYRRLPYLVGDRHSADLDALFREAQTEYLKRNWDRAERILRQILAVDDADVDARILFATLLRRRGRQADSLFQLQEMSNFVASNKWRLEIVREGEYLRRTVEADTAEAERIPRAA